jgi:hypothetical protein
VTILAVALLAGTLFVWVQMRSRSPLADLEIFTSRSRTLGLSLNFIMSLSRFGVLALTAVDAGIQRPGYHRGG